MGLPPGTTTDDTAMARNLIRSLVERGALDTDDVLARHIAWLATRPPDVGNLTRVVLSRVAQGVADAAREYVDQRGPEVSAGNGSVMYCAPLGVAYAARPDALFELAPALSAITHWDERCRTACLAITLAVASLVRGDAADRTVIDAVTAVATREGGEELEYLVEAAGRARPVDGPDMGFTLFTAGLALQVVAEQPSFEDGLRRVVALGGDTDTNAAVAGALLGALHGRSGLPAAWLERLQDLGTIEDEAAALAELAERQGGTGPAE
jgi:ADP-ribosyl-[dinitrogen reductase] hydrolase